MQEQYMRFYVYYIPNKSTPLRYFARLGCTLHVLETLFNGFDNAGMFYLKQNNKHCDIQTKPKYFGNKHKFY